MANSLATYHLVTVVLLCEHSHGRLNNTTSQTQHQMQCGLYSKKRASWFKKAKQQHNKKTILIII